MLLLQDEFPLSAVTSPHVWGTADYFMASMITLLGVLRVVELGRSWGFIPEKSAVGMNTYTAKNVGRLTVESLKSIVRHESVAALQPLILKIDLGQKELMGETRKQGDTLNEINLGITKMVTILQERKD